MGYKELDDINIQKGGAEYDPLPEDVYLVKITKIDKIQDKKWQSDQLETKLNFEFSLLSEEYKGRKLYRKVRPVLSYQPKESNLYSIACAALRFKLGDKDFEEFHLSNLMDKELRVSTAVVEKNGKKYNNIAAFLKSKNAETSKEPEIEETIEIPADE